MKDEHMTHETTPAPSVPGTLILGLGNPLRGDDGVGVHLAQSLAQQTLPDDIEVVDGGTQGLGLIPLLEGRQRVILVDAADIGRTPGEFRRFTLQEAVLAGDDRHIAIHAAGLKDALLLATTLKILPNQVVIFGVQPATMDWNSALSPLVEAALPDLMAAVLTELTTRNQE